jgi:hypothetical protein
MEKVQPDFAQTPGWVVYRVSVYRPRGASYWIQANNYAISGGPALAARPPLTFAQLAKIALDPRWGFTISRSFVAAARNLKVTGDGVG